MLASNVEEAVHVMMVSILHPVDKSLVPGAVLAVP